jgi:hypothetical protein
MDLKVPKWQKISPNFQFQGRGIVPNDRKIGLVAIKPKFPQIWIFGLKTNHLATLLQLLKF